MREQERFGVPVTHMTRPDAFVAHGDVPTLHKLHGMDAEAVHKKAMELMGRAESKTTTGPA